MKKIVSALLILITFIFAFSCKKKSPTMSDEPAPVYTPSVTPTCTESYTPENTGTITMTHTITETASITPSATVTVTNTPGWQTVGQADISANSAAEVSLKNCGGGMFLSYTDNNSNPVIKTFSTGSWIDSYTTANAGRNTNQSFYSTGSALYWVPFYSSADDPLLYFNGTAWSQLSVYPSNIFNYSVASDGTNIYAAGADVYAEYKFIIKKFDGAVWTDITSPLNITNVAAESLIPSMEIFGGELYLAYNDQAVNGVAVVKYTGTSWETVGTSPIIAGTPSDFTLKTSAANLYLALNYSGYTKPAVFMLNGTSWQDLNSLNISDSYAGYIAFNVYAGTPYVAYRDIYNSYKVTVKKYNGSVWTPVGNAVTSGSVDSISIDFDNSGVPYVAVSDNTNSNKARVFKFE